MKIRFIFVGRKNNNTMPIVDEYIRKINYTCPAEILLLSPSGLGGDQARKIESEKILSKLNTSDTVWLLDETGESISSLQLADMLASIRITAKNITIVVGGAFGVSQQLKARVDYRMSVSDMIFPHEIVWLMVTEQIYRGFEILKGSNYHHV